MQILAGILIPPLGGLLENLAPIIFLILYGIFQIIAGKAEAKKKAARPRQPRPPKPANIPGGAAPAEAPPNQADALRREVEEFLRRAQGKPPVEEKPVPVASVAPSRQPLSQRPATQRSPPRQRQPAPRKPNLRSEGVSEHVSLHVRSTAIAEHAEHLGDELEQADERMDSRLREKFDHQLGDLQHKEKVPKKTSQQHNIAAEIVELLRKPEGMRQLIVAQEILRRPERW